jgi:hypothetical protein
MENIISKTTSTVPKLVSIDVPSKEHVIEKKKLIVITEKHKNSVFLNVIILIVFIIFIVFFLLNCKEDGLFKVETDELEGYYF